MNLSVSRLLSLLLLPALLLPSCQKDEGPSFKDQVTGEWKSSNVRVDNDDLTDINQYSLTLESSYEFNLDLSTPQGGAITTISESGDWSENAEKQDITFVFNNSGKTITYDVTIISETQMVFEFTNNGSRFQITFDRLTE